MGTLSTVGILDGDSVSSGVISKYRDSIVGILRDGITLGSTSLPPGSISLGKFETGTTEDVISEYPAWNAYYVEGLLSSIAKGLDTVPDTGAAFPFLFDPTRPIAIILTELSAIFEPINSILSSPITDIIVSQIGVFLSKGEEIASKLKEIVDSLSEGIDAALEKAEEFFEIIKSAIEEALDRAGEAVEEVISKIEEAKDTITQKIVEIAENIKNAALSLVPDFSLPVLDISFLDPSLSITPLFATVERDGQDGIATKFIKLMTVFLKIPSEIIETVTGVITGAISEATESILQLVDAIKKIFTDIVQAVKDMLQALLGLIWERISATIDINPNAVLEIASTISVVIFFVKSFIVTLVGFVLGSGLIATSVSKILEVS
jgi:hypothetical protein